ncbi:MAG TPA: DUF4159 domain-containing protein [Gemmataceae bacterium]|nr:DUF4159 domain-containing protein [Gemmataceae bacterium]
MRPFCSVAVVFAFAAAAPAQAKKEPLVLQVKTGIERGVRFLKDIQRADGSWEVNVDAARIQGGWTSLAVLAFLNAGVPVEDSHVKKGLAYLRGLETSSTYVRALQTMVFVEAGQVEDRQRIRDNITWLIDARVIKNSQFSGWNYSNGPAKVSDNSNTQYALLGLWAGRRAGVSIKREIWESIRDYYLKSQEAGGAWVYSTSNGPSGYDKASLTMTTAGLCGLLIAGMELNMGREVPQPDGTALDCGIYEENKATAKALNWIGSHFTADDSQIAGRVFYNLYGLERTGRLTGQRFLGGHDWYREGCQYLVREQRGDGSWWIAGAGFDHWPAVSTSFALLFLSKGRTPILISKLAHGVPFQGRDADTDWNNDRNDVRNLVAYSGDALFKRLPLAWQTFDIMHAATPRGQTVTEEDELDATSDLLQSPIVYFNGHKSPFLRFTKIEKKILQRYIDNGGFILAEACCGSPAFDAGFKELATELWPDNELTELNADHPVWKSHFLVAPGNPYKLWGISLGCKTVLIYSPRDLSCQWESNNLKDGMAFKAFQLGTNIVAYATGREPPKPRLTQVEVTSGKDDPRTIPRGYFKVAQIRHRGDWQAAPKAMRNLMEKMRTLAGLDVVLKTEEVLVDSRAIVDFKFLYMHGRREFHFENEELDRLRFNLENGGLLFADACCGQEAFDKAFRVFAKQLFPKEKLIQVGQEDDLFSKDLNGVALTQANIMCRRENGGLMRNTAPYLEGVKTNDRWVLLYSKYDIGCALERHQSVDCLGYHPDSAFKIAGAAVLYSLRP